MRFSRSGRTPQKQAGRIDVSGDELRQQGDQLRVSSGEKIRKTGRLGGRELEDQLFHRPYPAAALPVCDRRDAVIVAMRRGARGRLDRLSLTYRYSADSL
jgi:hypothetical protein